MTLRLCNCPARRENKELHQVHAFHVTSVISDVIEKKKRMGPDKWEEEEEEEEYKNGNTPPLRNCPSLDAPAGDLIGVKLLFPEKTQIRSH